MDDHNAHASKLLGYFQRMRKSGQLIDMLLEVEDELFPCHRAVLAACSLYFHTMFTCGLQETRQRTVRLLEVSAESVSQLIEFAYTGRVEVNRDNVYELYAAACFFQVAQIRTECARFLRRHLDVTNCVQTYVLSDLYGLRRVRRASKKLITEHFLQVSQSPMFLDMPAVQLQDVIASDDVMVTTEQDIVDVIMTWVREDPDERGKHLPELLMRVRVPYHIFHDDKYTSSEREDLDTESSDSNQQIMSKGNTTFTESLVQLVPRLGFYMKNCVIFYARSNSFLCFCPTDQKMYRIEAPPGDMEQTAPCLVNFSLLRTEENELLAAGGRLDTDDDEPPRLTRSFLKYDVHRNTWERLLDMTTPRENCQLVFLEDNFFAIGGFRPNGSATCERYDHVNDTWTPMASLPCSDVVNLKAVAVDDGIVVISREGMYRYCLRNDRWDTLPSTFRRIFVKATAFNEQIFGVYFSLPTTSPPPLHLGVYRSETKRWQAVGTVPLRQKEGERPLFVEFLNYREELYLLYGWRNGDECIFSSDRYKPSDDTWVRGDLLIPPLYAGNEIFDLSCFSAKLVTSSLKTVSEFAFT
ncbi:PREDICTED: kelch repeat and BTB domain-containing protein 2-like [Branchiostoma belcheri]|uniref:Kelch repeat and BTB domain-containing protein 2-like n=1 Tax=Branchiostoma belcheri TaxID=7741 RepID=A0A6P4ZK19_BRABE|nr:PREDICTED: kelch repeat and BTB domain-containing protein 2-like [Branchiostoma belcheri]